MPSDKFAQCVSVSLSIDDDETARFQAAYLKLLCQSVVDIIKKQMGFVYSRDAESKLNYVIVIKILLR